MRASAPAIHVAAGCLLNGAGEVLICQRPAHKIYPGEWEFPGGKIEPGESTAEALHRELREELDVEVTASRPLIRLQHEYPELKVDLDVHLVTAFRGDVRAHEHPAIAWVRPDELGLWKLLAADRPIVSALRLPDHYVFTPPDIDAGSLCRGIGSLPACSLVRLRLPGLDQPAYREVARRALPVCREFSHPLILDRDPAMVDELGADGWHATAAELRRLTGRPISAARWFAASCHDRQELEAARNAGADFVVLGPVQPTGSHPNGQPLGWPAFGSLARAAGLPVYAIGGLSRESLESARAGGAAGVAGISAYWPTASASGP